MRREGERVQRDEGEESEEINAQMKDWERGGRRRKGGKSDQEATKRRREREEEGLKERNA